MNPSETEQNNNTLTTSGGFSGLSSGGLGAGLGGLSSLSTLTGLLDSAATFKPRKEDDRSGQRGGAGDHGGFGGNRNRRGDGEKYDDSFRGSYRTGGRRDGAWDGDRQGDFGSRVQTAGNSEVLNKSFMPRGTFQPESKSRVQHEFGAVGRSFRSRSSLSTPGGGTASPPSDGFTPPTPAKTDISDQHIENNNTSGSTASPPSVSGQGTPDKQHSTPHATATAPRTTPPNSGSTTTGATPWRPRRNIDPTDQLRRETNGCLNKLTIENFPTVGERLAQLTENIQKMEDFAMVVEVVLDKAFNEPDFSELYGDLCLVLSYRWPKALVENNPSSGKPQSLFSSILIDKWKEAFDKLPTTVNLSDEQKANLSVEDQEILIFKMKSRVRGLCVSLAEFVVRKMVGMRGFNAAASLLLAREKPEEHFVEGMCQMISTAGAFLDEDPVGKLLLENCFGRLQEIQSQCDCSIRLHCLIQDLVDARKVGWHKKIHKEKAKGLTAIKEEIENADLVGGSVVLAQYGTIVKLGQRSNLEGNVKYSQYIKSQEEKALLERQIRK